MCHYTPYTPYWVYSVNVLFLQENYKTAVNSLWDTGTYVLRVKISNKETYQYALCKLTQSIIMQKYVYTWTLQKWRI